MQAAAPAKWCWACAPRRPSERAGQRGWVKNRRTCRRVGQTWNTSARRREYHMGFFRYGNRRRSGAPWRWRLTRRLLEIVSPVVIVSVYARPSGSSGRASSNKVLPITIHGDRRTSQGVVRQETLKHVQASTSGQSVRASLSTTSGLSTLTRWMRNSTPSAPTSVNGAGADLSTSMERSGSGRLRSVKRLISAALNAMF